MSFNKIIGNEEVKKSLQNSVIKNNIPHALMFVGKEGIGKKIFAIEYAKMILCENKENMACEECKSCKMILTNNHPDFKIIEPDGNSIKIEQIRQIVEKVYEKPVQSDKKIYIINDAEKMTVESNNCLLKILEEPPEYIVIILIVSNLNMILDTIKSRCNKVLFKEISNIELEQFLKESGENINSELLNIANRKYFKTFKIKRQYRFI